MKRTRSLLFASAMCISLVLPSTFVRAETPLSIIPADAIGFVCVQNLQKLDTNAGMILQELGLAPMVPPAYRSIITMLKEYGPLGDGLNEEGALAVVMLAPETPDQTWDPTRMALIISATDSKALLESLSPEPSEDGTSLVQFFGNPSYAITTQNALVIAPVPASAKALAKNSAGIDSKLKPQEMRILSDLDIAFWVNAAEGLKLVEPMLNTFMSGFQAMSGAEEGSFQAIQTKNMMESIEKMREGADSISGGLTLGKSGLGFRFGMMMKPGSELAKLSGSQQTTDSSLLVGLPAEDYILAMGQIFNPEQAKESIKMLTSYLEATEVKEILGTEATEKLKTDMEEWVSLSRGMSLSVASLPPGPNGLIGVASVWKVTDANSWVSKIGDMVELVKGIPVEDEEAKAVLGAIQFKKDAGSVDGISVCHLSLDLEKLGELDADEIDNVKKVVGSEGLLLRVAAVDDRHAIITFGGGEARFAKVLAAAKTGKAPLRDDTGIKRVSEHLPKSKISEVYLAVDRIVGLIRNVNEAIGEGDNFPFTMASVNAPIAMASTGDKTSVMVDVFLPMELIVEIKNTAMMVMGQMMAGGGGPPAGVSEDEMADESDEEEDDSE